MAGLLWNIQNAGNQHENVTSDVLAEILNGIPACKEAFLNLFDPNIPRSSAPIKREVDVRFDDEKGRVDDEKGLADFCYRCNDCAVVIENKPWEPKSSINGQLSSYARVMQKWTEQRKYLCLLSVDANRKRLLNEIAEAENVSVSALEATFLKKNIIFRECTWEKVFVEFKRIQPDNKALGLWVQTLEDFFPKEIKLTEADQEEWGNIANSWDGKVVPIMQNLIRRIADKSEFFGYKKDGVGQSKGSYYGNYFYDRHTGMAYWIGAHKDTWRKCRPEQHRLFIVQVSEYTFKKLYKKPIPIVLDELRKVQFETINQNKEYVFPLIGLVDISLPQVEEMAEKTIRAMNAVRDLIAFGTE